MQKFSAKDQRLVTKSEIRGEISPDTSGLFDPARNLLAREVYILASQERFYEGLHRQKWAHFWLFDKWEEEFMQ